MQESEVAITDWDEEYWKSIIDSCFKQTKIIYRYDESTRLEDSVIKDKLLEPVLVYTLFDMHGILVDSNIDDDFLEELESVYNNGLNKDDIGFIVLNKKQKEFIENYKEDVASWLPLTYKKYVVPNSKNIRGLCCGSI